MTRGSVDSKIVLVLHVESITTLSAFFLILPGIARMLTFTGPKETNICTWQTHVLPAMP